MFLTPNIYSQEAGKATYLQLSIGRSTSQKTELKIHKMKLRHKRNKRPWSHSLEEKQDFMQALCIPHNKGNVQYFPGVDFKIILELELLSASIPPFLKGISFVVILPLSYNCILDG